MQANIRPNGHTAATNKIYCFFFSFFLSPFFRRSIRCRILLYLYTQFACDYLLRLLFDLHTFIRTMYSTPPTDMNDFAVGVCVRAYSRRSEHLYRPCTIYTNVWTCSLFLYINRSIWSFFLLLLLSLVDGSTRVAGPSAAQ